MLCPIPNNNDPKPKGLSIILATAFIFLFLWSAGIASASQDQDTVVIDTFIARQARHERGKEYREARDVLVGDLTHDGTTETVVLYTIEGQRGTNLYIQYLAVFARQKGKLSALTHTEVGGKSVRSVELTSVENNSVFLKTMGYGPKDASCCPSVKGTTRYVLMGRTLREQKQRASKRIATCRPACQTNIISQ